MTLTAKRQATLPAKLCDEMHVSPGDKLLLERCEINGKAAWVIFSGKSVEKPWFGRLRKYALQKSHDMTDIRKSIGKNIEKGS